MRALSVAAALLLGWVVGHWPVLEREVADAAARVRQLDVARADIAAERYEAAPVRSAALPPELVPLAIAAPYPAAPAVGAAIVDVRTMRRSVPRRTEPRLLDVAWTLPTPAARRPATAAASDTAGSHGFILATAAYAALAANDRRAAARGFAAAVAADPDHPRATAWVAERRRLTKRWSSSAYSFVRAPGSANAGTAPILGGGQSGATLAWTPNPLARRPISLTARTTSGNDPRQSNAEAAFGVRWQPLHAVTLSVERLVAVAPGGRNDWTARVTGGAATYRGRAEVSAYGEAGIVGIKRPNIYAAAQVRAGYRVATFRNLELVPGAGIWASVQHDRDLLDRVDVGPSLVLHWRRPKLPLDVAVDYRWRAAGNAQPGSGVALTLSTGF